MSEHDDLALTVVIADRFTDIEPIRRDDVWDPSVAAVHVRTARGTVEFLRWGSEYAATLRTCDVIVHVSGAWRVHAPGEWSDGVRAEGRERVFVDAVRAALRHVALEYELKEA